MSEKNPEELPQPKNPSTPPQRTPHHIPETIAALWNWAWGFFELQSVGDDVKEHAPLIRKRVSVLVLLFLIGLLGWSLKGCKDEGSIDDAVKQSQNSSALAQTYKAQLDAANNQIIQLKVDANESKREKDAEVQRITGERDAALQRITQLESLPSTAANMYISTTNMMSEMQTATRQFESDMEQSTNSQVAVADLGEKTSDITVLPDGRTMFGGVLTGKPKIAMADFDDGTKDILAEKFQQGLLKFQKGIKEMETPIDGVMINTSSEFTPNGKAAAYDAAALCAQMLRSNELAKAYAEKGVAQIANWRTKQCYTATLVNLAETKYVEHDTNGSFNFYRAAVTNYESINWETNRPTIDVKRLYLESAYVAYLDCKTNEAIQWSNRLVSLHYTP